MIQLGLKDWITEFILVVLTVVILVMTVYLRVSGQTELLQLIVGILAPLSAFTMAFVGLWIYGIEGIVREDHYHMMNILLSLGLLDFSIAEITAGVIGLLPDGSQFHFIVGLVQLPGILLWLIGTIGYVRNVNGVLDYIDERRFLLLIFFVSIVLLMLVPVFAIIALPDRNPVVIIVMTPVLVGTTIITGGLLWLAWVFRKGVLSRPIVVLLLGALVFLGLTIYWCCFSGLLISTGQIIAIISYMIVGIYLKYSDSLTKSLARESD